ncbi:MAG: hypothetical protein NC432_00425 [Roseburia sp.]|nr:hypothetical protein [Roseburia sp.]MCM1098348.1 hypothetical protein [Ruminococcus flavefaciens]
MKRSFHRSTDVLKNLPGLLLSLAAAFGGLFLVQRQLSREAEDLLTDSGRISIPVSSQSGVSAAESLAAALFTQEDPLPRFAEDLENRTEAVLHDPLPGQLSMPEALEEARNWLEEFFMPRLSAADFRLSEYKTDCYLWTIPEEGETEPNPLYSYWSITLRSQELEAALILNALTGQVLDAFIVCAQPAGYQAEETLPILLADYADSLPPGDSFSLFFSEELLLEVREAPSLSGEEENPSIPIVEDSIPKETDGFSGKGGRLDFYQSLEGRDLYAAVSAGSVAVSSPESPEYTELLSIRLYLMRDAAPR